MDCSTGTNVPGTALISEMMLTGTYNLILHHLSAHTRVALTSDQPAYGPESKDVIMDYTKVAAKVASTQTEDLENAMGRFLVNLERSFLGDPAILDEVKTEVMQALAGFAANPQKLYGLLSGQARSRGAALGTGTSGDEDSNAQDRADRAELQNQNLTGDRQILDLFMRGIGHTPNPINEPYHRSVVNTMLKTVSDREEEARQEGRDAVISGSSTEYLKADDVLLKTEAIPAAEAVRREEVARALTALKAAIAGLSTSMLNSNIDGVEKLEEVAANMEPMV